MGEEGCWRDDDLEVRIWHEINTDIPLPLPSNHDAPELGPALTALRSPAQSSAATASCPCLAFPWSYRLA